MKKVIWLALLTLILILVGRFAYDRYLVSETPLSDEEISQGEQSCQAREDEARRFISDDAKGRRTTEPRLFFSPSEKACIMTYLEIDPALPNPQTFNSYIIYNFDKKQRLDVKGNYETYLDKIKELGG